MTPSEQERDARESLAGSLCEALYWANPSGDHHDSQPCAYCLSRVGNSFAAVRRAVVAEAVAVVEGLEVREIQTEADEFYKRDGASYVPVDDALTALRGLSPEGM